ncbi:MAG: hypothetical protein JNL48_15935 [Acidobacteria bacterium]|nr:hypothetical protein [Acidobacteriota bacterium]
MATVSRQRTSTTQRAAALVGGALGAAGMVAGTRVLSGLDVPDYQVLTWLVVYNVVTSAVAVVVAVALWRGGRWATNGARGLAVAHALVLVGLAARRATGAGVADDSLAAMSLRTSVWALSAWIASRSNRSHR